MDQAQKDRLITALLAYEPEYAFLATHGDDAVPVLRELLEADDPKLAERATVLAFRIGTEAALALVRSAATDPRSEVRAVVAARAKQLARPLASSVLMPLLDDEHASIRRLAASSAQHVRAPELASKLRTLATADAELAVREMANAALRVIEP